MVRSVEKKMNFLFSLTANYKRYKIMSQKWTKVKALKAGSQIAVYDNGVLAWDEVVSVKSVGRERVYDIEVENSHNFVANNILAHNTYIFGNVGIGTTEPLTKLDVMTSAAHRIQFGAALGGVTNDYIGGLYWESDKLVLQSFQVGVAWQNVLIAPSGGNVGIGTTGPGAQLDLSTDSARKLTTNTWTTGSDIRIKTNVQNIDNALETIRQIRPVQFHYNSDFLANHPEVKDIAYYNFIAQEYQQVFPDSVTETDGLLYLNSSNMIPYAIAAIQEQQKQIEELKLVINQNGNLSQDGQELNSQPINSLTEKIKQALASLGFFIENGIARIKELIAEKITTKQLCIEDICVDRNQLKQLLEQANLINQLPPPPPPPEPQPAPEPPVSPASEPATPSPEPMPPEPAPELAPEPQPEPQPSPEATAGEAEPEPEPAPVPVE